MPKPRRWFTLRCPTRSECESSANSRSHPSNIVSHLLVSFSDTQFLSNSVHILINPTSVKPWKCYRKKWRSWRISLSLRTKRGKNRKRHAWDVKRPSDKKNNLNVYRTKNQEIRQEILDDTKYMNGSIIALQTESSKYFTDAASETDRLTKLVILITNNTNTRRKNQIIRVK